eukprot:CAMPEP_0172301986 /NCGR_PEP_ID=MMETSP1058-20130122/3767_1 /TAXON_ID=83371 /ORGANISM="Detonula confervacea, Strain CCMP 353" /LENGTH=404 /DNA_ID=CAMNT_0013012309 /DNA_START=107 /DNA_END=1321 /DNA_ORIENTATION=+
MKRTRDCGQVAGPNSRQCRPAMMTASNSTTSSTTKAAAAASTPPPLYLAEGLVAVHKPLTWSSQDVVAYVRGILIQDAKDRGIKEPAGRRKKPLMKVGHGGTLDPLASGVLVLGVGKGTSMLQSYLEGDKQYTAACQLGYETDTLDAEGKLVKEAPWVHVENIAAVEAIIPKFTGKIEQVPPLYSAIRVDGKRLYEIARGGDASKAEEVEIPKREVEIFGLQVGSGLEADVIRSGVVDGPVYREKAQALEAAAAAAAADAAAALEMVGVPEDGNAKVEEGSEGEGGKSKKKRGRRNNKKKRESNFKKCLFDEITVPAIESDDTNSNDKLELPQFALSVQCGGGTYIRSLVRDIGYELDTVATMTGLVRTKQGPFVLEDALRKEDWTADTIYEAIRKSQERQIGV